MLWSKHAISLQSCSVIHRVRVSRQILYMVESIISCMMKLRESSGAAAARTSKTTVISHCMRITASHSIPYANICTERQ
jgi:hypothetical protein